MKKRCPVCRATSDDAHKLDCPHRTGKGLTIPAILGDAPVERETTRKVPKGEPK